MGDMADSIEWFVADYESLGRENHKAERLEQEADRLEREATRIEGTCWLGDMPPSTALRLQAREKREHARLLRESV